MPSWLGLAQAKIHSIRQSILVELCPPSTFAGGTIRIEGENKPEPLVREPTPCRSVWIGPPVDERGRSTNRLPVYIGDARDQNMALQTNNYLGFVIPIDDASKIYIRSPAAGEQVVYRISGDT